MLTKEKCKFCEAYAGNAWEKYVPIKYCPMCGRGFHGEKRERASSVFIFQLYGVLKKEDVQKIRNEIEEQIKTGLVVIDSKVKFVGREILLDGEEVEIIIKQAENEER